MKKIAEDKKVRVRFAPSPTGFLHIGGARTALVNYLFAKSQKGKFVLRIEDTDRKRLVENSVGDITDSLKWLSLGWDEGPYRQSERLGLYEEHAEMLVKTEKAYYCFCTPARLDILKKTQTAQGKTALRYDGRCRHLTPEQIAHLKKSNKKHVIRFKMPQMGRVRTNDLIRGVIEFDTRNLDDFILLKSDGYPTYHLANVVDDHFMRITHVIRGDEWISSVPKHTLLYEAFGWGSPKFVHLPVILSPSGGKLSKREGDVSIKDFRARGYLPEALINFIVLLGWNPGDDREIFGLNDLVKEFSMERVGKSSGVFDSAKLNYLNGYYIRKKTGEDLLRVLRDFNPQVSGAASETYLLKVIGVVKDRLVTLSDFPKLTSYFFNAPEYSPKILIFKKSDKTRTLHGLKAALSSLAGAPEKIWSGERLGALLAEVVRKNGLSNGDVFWPVRAALSGSETSPSPNELLFVLGKRESSSRIEKAISVLENRK